jgi:hypothetical protein
LYPPGRRTTVGVRAASLIPRLEREPSTSGGRSGLARAIYH